MKYGSDKLAQALFESHILENKDYYGEYELYKAATGWNIRCEDLRYPGQERYLYVSKVKKDGTYEYMTDSLYAKDFSEATGKKHLEILTKGK